MDFTEKILNSEGALVINPKEFFNEVKRVQGIEVKEVIRNTEDRLVFRVDKEIGEGFKLDFRRRSPSDIDIYTTDPNGSGLIEAHSGRSEEAAWWEYDFLLETIDTPLKLFGADEVEKQGDDLDENAFSDEEIQGIISTLSDEGVIGEPYIQIDASGVSTRSEDNIPQWSIREAESKSAPFTVRGHEYVAFDGRGYTAVVNQ